MEGFATIWGLPVLTWLAVGSTHLCSTSDPRCLLRNVEGKRKPFVCIQWSLAGLGPHCGNQRVQVEVLFLESVLFIYWQGEQCFFLKTDSERYRKRLCEPNPHHEVIGHVYEKDKAFSRHCTGNLMRNMMASD